MNAGKTQEFNLNEYINLDAFKLPPLFYKNYSKEEYKNLLKVPNTDVSIDNIDFEECSKILDKK